VGGETHRVEEMANAKKKETQRVEVMANFKYRVIPGNRNWQIKNCRLESGCTHRYMSKETLCAPRNIAEKLAGWVKNRGFYFPG